MTDDIKLLPCPCCGAPAVTGPDAEYENSNGEPAVECSACNVMSWTSEDWNRRITVHIDRQQRGEAVYPIRQGRQEGRLAEHRWRVGDVLPAVGSYCLVSGVNCDIESDQHRGYSWRKVIGYSTDRQFVCFQTGDCWPTVERTVNCWFAEIPHPAGAAPQPAEPVVKQTLTTDEPLRSALTELVILQNMKKRMAKIAATPDYLESSPLLTEYDRLSSEYSKRRPVAWDAARAALAQPTTQQSLQVEPMEWQDAQRIADLPEVDELLQGFADDPTGDNGTMIVRAVMRSTRQSIQPVKGEPSDADAKGQWRRLALQFDNHRMQALGWLRAAVERLPEQVAAPIKEFLKAPPLSGEKVLAERLARYQGAQTAVISDIAGIEYADGAITLHFDSDEAAKAAREASDKALQVAINLAQPAASVEPVGTLECSLSGEAAFWPNEHMVSDLPIGEHDLFATPVAAQVAASAEPIQVTTVATVTYDDSDEGPVLKISLGGGASELPDGAELFWASAPITGDDGRGVVYTTPVAAQLSVPEFMKYSGLNNDDYAAGWNDCRAAMLHPKEPPTPPASSQEGQQ